MTCSLLAAKHIRFAEIVSKSTIDVRQIGPQPFNDQPRFR
jgi:hypothetical protein